LKEYVSRVAKTANESQQTVKAGVESIFDLGEGKLFPKRKLK
jgi:hypothetical protein